MLLSPASINPLRELRGSPVFLLTLGGAARTSPKDNHGLRMPASSGGGLNVRTVAIWFAGLLASGIFGWLIDAKFLSTTFFPDGGPGMIGGMLAFACARLWFTAPRKDQGLSQF